MGFAGVYRAVYAYSAASEQELSLQENDILYLISTADDGWWSVKKRVVGAASEEPEGIVPHNYIEPAKPEGSASALYSYDQQSDEELSFSQGTVFEVYATEGDWILAGANGSFGFVPANYVKLGASTATEQAHTPTHQPVAVQPVQHAKPPVQEDVPPPKPQRPTQQQPRSPILDEDDDDYVVSSRANRDKALPAEPSRRERREMTWPVMDVVGRRKLPKTLVVHQEFVTLINDDGGGQTQKWDVPDIVSYSSEKKYVFLDLVNPKASLQLRVNSSSEASQIVASVGQIVGAGRAGGGLQEVISAAEQANHKQGEIMLDFEAEAPQELSVTEGESVTILQTSKKDWWLVRNKYGKEGLVPRKFVHIDREENKLTGLFRGKKQREKQWEKDHEEAVDAKRSLDRHRSTASRPGLDRKKSSSSRLERGASVKRTNTNRSLPDTRKMRLWVDRTGTFKVDAQLLGCSDGKIHLHKSNGVKIAVPASKLSVSDIEYVESITGVNLSDDKPLNRSKSTRASVHSELGQTNTGPNVAGSERHEFWLSFFLSCGVDPQNANRYAKNFARDNMDESSLGDANASVLRTLGLREGDILRVTKKINERLGRVASVDGGLYSNEGVLQNNSGTTPKSVEREVWSQNQTQADVLQPQITSVQVQPQPTAQVQSTGPNQAQLQPQLTTQVAQPIQPQLTQPVLQPQLTQAAMKPAPPVQATGALADLLGMTPASQPMEADVAAKQRQNQEQILKMQANLQREQIRLLKEQQEQLRKQQEELVQIQKTGSQLQALGPFATGVAQKSTFIPASQVLAQPPPPPQSRVVNQLGQMSLNGQATGPFQASQATGPFQATQSTGPAFQANQLTGQNLLNFQSNQATGQATGQSTGQSLPNMFQTTGQSFAQPAQSQIGPMGTTFQSQPGPLGTSFQSQATGPFQGGVQSQATGPFQGVQSQATGPFQGVQSQATGPFQGVQSQMTSFPGVQPQTTSFQGMQSQATGPFQAQSQPAPSQGVQSQATGPFQGIQTPALQNQPAPFQSQTTGPFQSQPFQTTFQATGLQGTGLQGTGLQGTGLQAKPIQSFPSQTTGPFLPQLSQTTGPFQSQPAFQSFAPQTTGPFQPQQPMQQPMQPATFQTFQQPPTSFQQQPMQPMQPTQFQPQQSLQSQATGFGFGNQTRANVNMASASNPFGL